MQHVALFIHKFFWSSLLSARAFVHSMEESPRYVFPNTVTVYNFPNHLSTPNAPNLPFLAA